MVGQEDDGRMERQREPEEGKSSFYGDYSTSRLRPRAYCIGNDFAPN